MKEQEREREFLKRKHLPERERKRRKAGRKVMDVCCEIFTGLEITPMPTVGRDPQLLVLVLDGAQNFFFFFCFFIFYFLFFIFKRSFCFPPLELLLE